MEKENSLIIGDINMDLIRDSEIREQYLNVMSEFDFIPAINLPTRERACMDHIFVRSTKSSNDFQPVVLRLTVTFNGKDSPSLEIQNVPENKNENLLEIVNEIGSDLEIQVDGTSKDYATRVPSALTNKPKYIIVKFLSKSKRDNFLGAYEAKRMNENETRPGLKVADVSDRFYINEHLTMKNKILFKEARKTVQICLDGDILMRSEVSDTTKILHISHRSDLDKL
ncbi:hypothetical protein HHI36_004420 [Cryptolaemus montrouzieri]|uniref:Uncharacterized protein n=1 Tax=Cryptolaemus montrouzieri TaxID=559131 RepID=A0ABD2NRA6_9CUCU